MEIFTYSTQKSFDFSYIRPTETNLQLLLNITNQLIELYEDFFGMKMRPFHLINYYDNDDYPMTVREKNIIFIDCPYFNKNQFTYQLSHELCHWMIPVKIKHNLRWLDETIAVTASAFFPSKIKAIDTDLYNSYLTNSIRRLTPKCVRKVSAPTPKQLSMMETGKYSPDFTDYGSYWNISKYLFPVINSNPLFWKAVPLLCEVPEGLTLKASLDNWIALCPSPVNDALTQVTTSLLPRRSFFYK